MHTAVVAGASGGLGLAIISTLCAQPHWQLIVGISRRTCKALEHLAKEDERVLLLFADIVSEEDLRRVAEELHARACSLELLCNCIGILHQRDFSPPMSPEKRLEDCRDAWLHHAFDVNALTPLRLGQALLPLIPRKQPTVFASFSARVGSIGDNHLGGWYSYRVSKAAHNMMIRTLAIELARRRPQLTVIAYHPGTVDTGLSRPFQSNVPPGKLLTPKEAAEKFVAVVDRLNTSHNGRFFAWDGSEIPW